MSAEKKRKKKGEATDAELAVDEMARRQGIRQMHAVIGSLLLALVCLELNYLSFRHFERWDWTSDARFTLSQRTEEVVGSLGQTVDVYLLLSEAEPNFADVDELLQRYRASSPNVRVVHVDPDKEPGEARRVAERFDIEMGVASTGESFADVAAVVSAGERRWKITRDDLFSVDFGEEGEGPAVDVKAERALTGAIVQVTQGEPTQLCLSSGRGEWSPSGERPLDIFREELERENIELREVNAVGLRRVPEECDAFFVLGPQRAFGEDEARALVEWSREGGNLLLALDPIVDRESVAPTGFEEPLADLGVQVDRDVLLEMDPRYLLRRDPSDLFRVLEFGDHPTTETLAQLGGGMALNLARSVRAEEGSGVSELLRSSPAAFGETDLAGLIADADLEPDADDLRGPLSLAVAFEAPPTPERAAATEADARRGRVIVVGDSAWLEPALLMEPQFANLDALMAWTGWLTQREALIAIPPRRSDLQAIVMSEADVSGVALRVFVFLPAAILLLGFAVWWSRRQ